MVKGRKPNICHLSKQGTVSIPKKIRDRYKISPREDLTFECYDNGIFIRFSERLNGMKTAQITLDEYAAKEMKKLQGNHQARPIQKHTDKCTLCGCLHDLVLYNGGAYCPVCLDRIRDFDKQMEIVKKAAYRAKRVNVSTSEAMRAASEQIIKQNSYVDSRREKYKNAK